MKAPSQLESMVQEGRLLREIVEEEPDVGESDNEGKCKRDNADDVFERQTRWEIHGGRFDGQAS